MEIINIIFDLLPIADKRNLINQMPIFYQKLASEYETDFIKLENNTQ